MNMGLKLKLVAMATAALGFTAVGCGGSDAEETPAATDGAGTAGGEGQASCSGHAADPAGGGEGAAGGGEGGQASCSGSGSCSGASGS